MLILTRKENEEIKIGPDIVIKVISTSEGQVKLGITAPANVEILRAEIYEKVKESTIEASVRSKQQVSDLKKLDVNKIRKMNNEKK